ncbi:MAG: recombinase family protein [Beduini sp.]|uniref:recombinase family protein n=1 Tax=Beduini sp. TaxID=1922300 RepID=UPI0011CAE414
MVNNFGYIRVSTKDQNDDRQKFSLDQYDIPKKNLYTDKLSGKDFNRPAYKRMIKRLKNGDIVYVKSIDRLGRNYEEIIDQWKLITKKIGADIVVIDMPLLNTTRSKDLLGTFISDLVLQLLSFVAQNERENIRQRQAEGIEAAKKRGVKFGPTPINKPDYYSEVIRLFNKKQITTKEAADMLNVSISTFYRWRKK